MAVITPSTITNRLGQVISSPAATSNVGPVSGDIGADGATDTPASVQRVFDVTLTSSGLGDTATFAIPSSIQKLCQPTHGVAGCGLGLHVSVMPMNATARTGSPVMTQTPTTVILTFGAAAAGAIYRVVFNGMFSAAR